MLYAYGDPMLRNASEAKRLLQVAVQAGSTQAADELTKLAQQK
jgi:hypothetical protein